MPKILPLATLRCMDFSDRLVYNEHPNLDSSPVGRKFDRRGITNGSARKRSVSPPPAHTSILHSLLTGAANVDAAVLQKNTVHNLSDTDLFEP